jgi:glycosyltransferase involved in cell wall biosynthesis
VVRDGIDGFIVPTGDEVALAARLQQLRNDLPLRQRMGAQARERALQWPWSRYATAAADRVAACAAGG